MSRILTGKVHYRYGFGGKIVVRVQYKTPGHLPGDWNYKWKDASETDMARLGGGLMIKEKGFSV